MATIKQLMNLNIGDILHHVTEVNADKTPLRCRVNGAVKRWKRDPGRVSMPVKHGLWDYFYITEHNLDRWEVGDGRT